MHGGVLRGYVRPQSATGFIAANYPAFTRARRRDLLEALRTNGPIERTPLPVSIRYTDQSRIVYRLPYQRSVATSSHGTCSNPISMFPPFKAIEGRSSRPLTALAILQKGTFVGSQYAEPGGSVEHLINLEFPERAGSRVSKQATRTVLALPKSAQ